MKIYSIIFQSQLLSSKIERIYIILEAFYYGVVSYFHVQEAKYKENVKVKRL
jgi:hypothetical protein